MEKSPLVKERLVGLLRENIMGLQSDTLVKIPSERELAEQLGASRVSVRSAIQVLIRDGLLISLRGKGTYIVPRVTLETLYLLCSPDIKSNDPFYNKFLVEITNLSAKQSIKISMVDPDHPLERGVPSPLIIIGQLGDDQLDRLAAACGPLYAVHRYAHREDIIQIYFDDYTIGSKAAKTLADHGHRSFALLGGPDKYPSAKLRKQGFLDVSEQQGIPVKVISEKMNWEGGYRAADQLLQTGLPEAVFAVNDWMAVGFMQRLREKGVRVPSDISVVGCDDIALASEYSPKLTTFSLNMGLLVEELLSIIERTSSNLHLSRVETLLPAVLVNRESLTYSIQVKE